MSRPPRSIYGVDPRTAIRLVTVVVVFVPFVALFHETLFAYVDLLTATGVPSSRELTLALLAAFSIVPPLAIAIRVADLLYERYIDE
ncbi:MULTISPECIES: hypothetical protein [Halococcus]|uniref:Uncharacterized protein n=1 Tax=Halococcus salifodinae DSM 8989 TaxID=1227456 RepID=M0N546_9EURY|nr:MULTISPECIES: hypothetical protein [Halococcus]EMA52673.1 hypothetical protein C450_11268 [Halococcus salifodinae DSM 8989]